MARGDAFGALGAADALATIVARGDAVGALGPMLHLRREHARVDAPGTHIPLRTGTTCDGTRTTTASISTPKGAARPGITASGAAQHHSRIK